MISTEMCLIEQMFGDVMGNGINDSTFWLESVCLCDAIIKTDFSESEDV